MGRRCRSRPPESTPVRGKSIDRDHHVSSAEGRPQHSGQDRPREDRRTDASAAGGAYACAAGPRHRWSGRWDHDAPEDEPHTRPHVPEAARAGMVVVQSPDIVRVAATSPTWTCSPIATGCPPAPMASRPCLRPYRPRWRSAAPSGQGRGDLVSDLDQALLQGSDACGGLSMGREDGARWAVCDCVPRGGSSLDAPEPSPVV
jgi:hypothetical protein